MSWAKFAALLLSALATSAVSTQGLAQAYPSKAVRLISPYPPGGGTDATARIIAQALGEQLGQQVIVDTRPGASGRIGVEIASKAPPDGYTLVLGNVAPLAILPAAVAKLPYDPIKGFQPISLIATSDYVLTVHPSLPTRSVKELLALARAKPGQLTFASSGNLGAPHLAGELINQLAKVKLLHVPYKGNGPAAIAVMTGESTMLFGSGPSVVPHMKTGKLRALATTGQKRSMPDLPALNELLPGYDVTQWYGILVPAGVPRDIVERLHREIARAIGNAKVAQLFVNLGTQPVSNTPEEFAAFIKAETDKWGKVIRSANITAD
ncbi:MAG TPA: tripartite tricarboxylate transporter substrate binding protein [Burkholderiales bacterium]|nr:tripartite tricarboxylate transporter substrate binding protein [Burkholderiales bacterium]